MRKYFAKSRIWMRKRISDLIPWKGKGQYRMSTTISISMAGPDREQQAGRFGMVSISGQERNEKKEENTSVKLNGDFDPIEQKKTLAKKQAYKIVKDALARELKMDEDVQECRNEIEMQKKEMEQAQNEIGRINAEKDELRREYGVEEDSEEQKDLELLEKRAAYERGDLSKSLTDEEMERLSELDKRGYTEYQKRALSLDKRKAPHETTIRKAEQSIISNNSVIRETRRVRLKKDYIRKAQQEKDEALAAASKEVIGMLVDEAKEHMDEKAEEVKENAEEKAEEKEQEQEKLDAVKEKKEQMEEMADSAKADSGEPSQVAPPSGDEMTESMVQLDGQRADYQQEIEEMIKKMNLMAEDIKGIKVDGSF